MPRANLGAVGRRASLATAIALSLCSIPAHAVVVVDGILNDLADAVTAAPYNAASATDAQGSADSPVTENNTGFDIKNVYAFYDWPADVLYLGMNFFGTVGDSQPFTSSLTNEGSVFPSVPGCPSSGAGNNSRSTFDCTEHYTIQIFEGTTVNDPSLLSYKVRGINDGTDTPDTANNSIFSGLTVNYLVSETNNGVEFSIAGLHNNGSGPLSNFSFENPADLLIVFKAGASDGALGADDTYSLQMQVVPVPAAAWLFGTGLIGLVAAARKRQKTA